jgi:hypothetical protein
MMTLEDFRQYTNAEFAQHLPAIADADEDTEQLTEQVYNALIPRLEQKAISERVEVCEVMAHLLVLALFDCYLHSNAERLLVPPEYFADPRPLEDTAHEYLQERSLGGPARHNHLTVC